MLMTTVLLPVLCTWLLVNAYAFYVRPPVVPRGFTLIWLFVAAAAITLFVCSGLQCDSDDWTLDEPSNPVPNTADVGEVEQQGRILSLADQSNGPSPNNVPWHDTSSSVRSRKMLCAQYEWARVNNPAVSAFLEQHCKHLYGPPVDDTGVPQSAFLPECFKDAEPVQLTGTRSLVNMPVELRTGKAGCYVLYSESTEEYYTGSSVSFGNRYAQHYHSFSLYQGTGKGRHLYEVMADQGITTFQWKAVSVNPNYYLDYVKENPMDASDPVAHTILINHTQYEARLTESSVHHWLKPTLNGQGAVTFPVIFDPEAVSLQEAYGEPRSFEVLTAEGDTFTMPSLERGSQVLGTSRRTIGIVLNYDHYVNCPNIGTTARLYEPGHSIMQGSPYSNPLQGPTYDGGIAYEDLQPGYVFAYDSDHNLVGTFSSCADAARSCGFGDDYYRVSRYINKRFLQVTLGGMAMAVLFAQHPLTIGRTKGVVLTSLIPGSPVLSFSSVMACLASFWYTGDYSQFIKKHLVNGVPFQGYHVEYAVDYKGVLPLVTEVSKVRLDQYRTLVANVPKRTLKALPTEPPS